ncbi:MAG: hypothetical protein GKC10_09070 [Methanosarcinales archaeon]|nr:hypothetical protein [Methanosarcinales archaeon]
MKLSRDGLLEHGEFWLLLFVAGVILLNWPVLAIPGFASGPFGIPWRLVYIVAVWLLMIAFAYFFDRGSS